MRSIRKVRCDRCHAEIKADQQMAHFANKHDDAHAKAVLKELESLEEK